MLKIGVPAVVAFASLILTGAATPAHACRGETYRNYWLDDVPDDLLAGEVVLKVQRLREPQARVFPPYIGTELMGSGYDGVRLKILEVLVGAVDKDEVVIIPDGCGVWRSNSAEGDDVGIVSGFLTPDEAYWTDAPGLVPRDERMLERAALAAELRTAAAGGDLKAAAELYFRTPNPAERKQILFDLMPRLRAAAQTGDLSASTQLAEFERYCCSWMPPGEKP